MRFFEQESLVIIKKILQPYRIKVERTLSLPKDYYKNKKIILRIKEKVKSHKQVSAVFILQYPEMWNSHKSVHEAFKDDNRYKTLVLAVPKPIGVGRKEEEFEEHNAAAEFCEINKIEYIDARQNGNWIDINRVLSPDIVFIQRPYDSHMPKHLSLKRLSNNSILCYIPYGYEFGADIHLEYEYNRDFMNSVFCCFAENIHTYNYICKRSRTDVLFGVRKVFNIGYPRFDLIDVSRTDTDRRKIFLWTPRWSIDSENDSSCFLKYFESLIEYFTLNRAKSLVIRPHPLMFKNFIDTGVLTKKKTDEIIELVDNIPNISWDDNYDYLNSFKKADVLISDFSSLIIEFFITGKPIIYCGGKSESFNMIGKKMAKGLHFVSDKESLINKMDFLSNHKNPYFDYNLSLVNSELNNKERIGESIKRAIIESYLTF